MEQNRELRNRSKDMYTAEFQQSCKSNLIEGKWPFQHGTSFFFNYFIVVQLRLPAFSPPPPQPNPPPSLASTLPLDFVHVSFIVVPVIPSPHCPLPTPLWLLLDCS